MTIETDHKPSVCWILNVLTSYNQDIIWRWQDSCMTWNMFQENCFIMLTYCHVHLYHYHRWMIYRGCARTIMTYVCTLATVATAPFWVSNMMYSNYYSQLDVAVQSHYSAILALLCRIQDPYLHQTSTSDSLMEWQHWPEVEYADIYNYLVATPTAYTQDQLKAYISLDAYNFFANGRVANVSVTSVPRVGSYLIWAKVCHS